MDDQQQLSRMFDQAKKVNELAPVRRATLSQLHESRNWCIAAVFATLALPFLGTGIGLIGLVVFVIALLELRLGFRALSQANCLDDSERASWQRTLRIWRAITVTPMVFTISVLVLRLTRLVPGL